MKIGVCQILLSIGVTGKFLPANDLLAVICLEMEKAPAGRRGFLDL
jgi:hypothetical protein